MDEGTEAKPVTPAAGEVCDVDVGIAGSLPLAPDQQSFLGRQEGCADPKLLLEGQDSGHHSGMGWEVGRLQRPQVFVREAGWAKCNPAPPPGGGVDGLSFRESDCTYCYLCWARIGGARERLSLQRSGAV